MTQRYDCFNYDWEGETVAILATGSSLSDLPPERLAGCKVIAVNDAGHFYPDADILYASDKHWWEYHDYAPSFKGERWTQSIGPGAWAHEAQQKGLKVLQGRRAAAMSYNPRGVNVGHNSAFAALGLAVKSGASQIVFFGLDLGGSHFFGDHPGKLRRASPYETFRQDFEAVAGWLFRAGIIALNCSDRTTLRAFPTVSLDNLNLP